MNMWRKTYPITTYRNVQKLNGRTVYSSNCEASSKNDPCNGGCSNQNEVLCFYYYNVVGIKCKQSNSYIYGIPFGSFCCKSCTE